MTATPEPIDHIERWRRIVVARREQHDAICAAQGRTTGDYWGRRAEGFRKFVQEAARNTDPFLECLRQRLRAQDDVLDVGAGTGRHTSALAPQVRHITALDPSEAMLAFLHEDIAAQGLNNVDVIAGAWPDAAERAPQVDVAISAHVVYPIEDIVPFLRALDGHARRYCFLNLMAGQPWFDQLDLWEAVHGEARMPQPTYIEVVNVLHQLGCLANVEIVFVETPRVFEGLDEAAERFSETVAAGEDPERVARLRAALQERLQPLDGGRLAFPRGRYPIGTVWWEAGALQNRG
ncbi:MAG: class I SAM-dependent methyltransferase [Dehalococcoidia bacterium]